MAAGGAAGDPWVTEPLPPPEPTPAPVDTALPPEPEVPTPPPAQPQVRPLNPALAEEELRWHQNEARKEGGLLRPILFFIAVLAVSLVALTVPLGRAGLAIWLLVPVPILWTVMFGARSAAWLRRHGI